MHTHALLIAAQSSAQANPDYFQKFMDWLAKEGPGFLVDLIVFVLILIAGRFVISALVSITRSALTKSKKVSEILRNFITNVLHKVLWVILIMMALPKLGVNVAPLIAGLGVGGFIVGFAFQESLGNLAAGLMLLISQPYALGDYVEIGGISGTVKDMNIMATLLNTPDNKRVLVPNRKIWGTEIINYTALPTRRVDLSVGIHYGSDIGKALAVADRVLKAHPLVLKDPEPVLGVTQLADSSVNLAVRPWTKTSDYWTVYFDITRQIKENFDKEGIAIPFPQMDVHIIDMPKG